MYQFLSGFTKSGERERPSIWFSNSTRPIQSSVFRRRLLRRGGRSMKAGLVGTLLVAACCLTGWSLKPSVPAVAQAPAKRPQWQYAVYYHSDLMGLGHKTLNQNLSKLGEQGWELVAVTPGIRGEAGKDVSTQTTYFFKRPK